MKYQHKPIVVDAVRWKCANFEEIAEFCDEALQINNDKFPCELFLATPEERVVVKCMDWIVKNEAGEFSLCKARDFKELYEPYWVTKSEELEER